jgi:hypothetical protein
LRACHEQVPKGSPHISVGPPMHRRRLVSFMKEPRFCVRALGYCYIGLQARGTYSSMLEVCARMILRPCERRVVGVAPHFPTRGQEGRSGDDCCLGLAVQPPAWRSEPDRGYLCRSGHRQSSGESVVRLGVNIASDVVPLMTILARTVNLIVARLYASLNPRTRYASIDTCTRIRLLPRNRLAAH